MSTKLVSVVMPVNNAERFVEQAIRSVLDQSYQNIELVVVDDGSTDRSWEIVSSIHDERMHAFHQHNQGACVARNRGIDESHGEYLKFLDADDVLYSDAIEKQVEQMSHLGDDEEVFGDFDYMDIEGNVFSENHIDAEHYEDSNQDVWLFNNWYMLTGTPLHRREWIDRVKGFNVRLRRGQEAFLHQSLSLAGVHFVYMPGKIYKYRSYESSERITTRYYASLPLLSDVSYRLDTLWQLVKEKYSEEPSQFSSLLSQKYFSFADQYFTNGKAAEGGYCMRRAMEIPHFSRYPRYRHSHRLFRVYDVLGKVFGYLPASHITDRIASVLGHPKNASVNIEKMKTGKDDKCE